MPVLEGFWAWFEKQRPTKGTRMDKAITYIKNRRSDMMTYLEDGRCSFCNNLSEIEIKPVALGRKNYLFSDTVAGADASATIYSLVETAKANGLNMYHYLWYLLKKFRERICRMQPLKNTFHKILKLMQIWKNGQRNFWKTEYQMYVNC